MTIIFSTASAIMITMTADSVVTREFDDHYEFVSGRKMYRFPGVGCVGTWGERDGNYIGQFLNKQDIEPGKCNVDCLANLVEEYLIKVYQPDKIKLGEVGFHVAGFDQNHKPKLFHIFWGFDQPRPQDQVLPKYARYDHSPQISGISLLYNGRNDLANYVVNIIIEQIRKNNIVRYDIRNPITQTIIGDFVARFSAELSPEVGPPFFTCYLSPKNEIVTIENKYFAPISLKSVKKALESIDLQVLRNEIENAK
jgi:hypothetical protein